MMFSKTTALAWGTAIAIAACGQVESERANAAVDAGAAAVATDAGGKSTNQAPGAEATPSFTDGPGAPSTEPTTCTPEGGPLLPDGGSCDASRILVRGGVCVQTGMYCDELRFAFDQQSQPDAALPSAFDCSKELGVTSCTYDFGNGSRHGYVDAAALRAACDVTQLSASITVICVVLEH